MLAVSGSSDTTLRVWDMQTGECLRTLRGHILDVSDVALTPDGTLAVSSSHDKTVRVWDVTTGESLQVLQGHQGWV